MMPMSDVAFAMAFSFFVGLTVGLMVLDVVYRMFSNRMDD
jgi:hypothetical protein